MDTNKQCYQWIKTARAGEYVYEESTFTEDGNTLIKFTDGSQIYTDILDEYLVKVESEDDGYEVTTETINDLQIATLATGEEVEIPGVMHGHTKVTLVPKKQKKQEQSSKPIKKVDTQPTKNDSPVVLLLEKARKEKSIYTIKLEIETVSQSLYNVIRDTFDGGESEVLDYIISNIDIDEIKEQLKEKIKKEFNSPINTITDEQERTQTT